MSDHEHTWRVLGTIDKYRAVSVVEECTCGTWRRRELDRLDEEGADTVHATAMQDTGLDRLFPGGTVHREDTREIFPDGGED